MKNEFLLRLMAVGCVVGSVSVVDALPGSGSVYDKAIESIKFAQAEKDLWMSHVQHENREKVSLLRKQHDEMFKEKAKWVELFKKATLSTDAEKEAFIANLTERCMTMRDNHAQQWKDLEAQRRVKVDQLMKQSDSLRMAFSRGESLPVKRHHMMKHHSEGHHGKARHSKDISDTE